MFPPGLEVPARGRAALRDRREDPGSRLKRMRRELPKLAPGQGWQSEQTLHAREEFQQLKCVRRQGSEEHPSIPANRL